MASQVRSMFVCILALVCALLLPNNAYGQVDAGSIVGTVMDASAASVAGARVTVTNLQTNQTVELTTKRMEATRQSYCALGATP